MSLIQRGSIVIWLAFQCVPARAQADAAELRATGVASTAADLSPGPGDTGQALAFTRAKMALSSAKAAERIGAAHELDKLGQPRRAEAGALLRPLVKRDPDAGVRAAAARTLGRLGVRDAVPDLIAALSDPAPEVRTVAAAALWRLPDERATDPLVARLADESPAPREWAALALGVIGAARAVPALAACLDDSERAVRLAAVRSLGRIADPAGVVPVAARVDAAKLDAEEFEEAVNALAGMRSPQAIHALAALLHKVEAEEARAEQVVAALAQVGDASAVPALAHCAGKARSPRLRQAAAAARARVEERAQLGALKPAERP